MSHPINDQILERLYEEAFDEISIAQFAIYLSVSQPNDSKEFTDFVDKFRDGFEEAAAKLALNVLPPTIFENRSSSGFAATR